MRVFRVVVMFGVCATRQKEENQALEGDISDGLRLDGRV